MCIRDRLNFLGKESLFSPKPLAWFISALGGIPISRGTGDREALKAAQTLLEKEESIVVFPEGTRQVGDAIGEIYDGTAWLASKANTPVVPVGIAGTEVAMPTGSRFPSRVPVVVVVGEVLEPPEGPDGKRAKRSDLKLWTQELKIRLQDCQTRAREMLNN